MINLRPQKGQEAPPKAKFLQYILLPMKKACPGKWCFPLKFISPEVNITLRKDIRKIWDSVLIAT